ncbi:alpha-ketoacid dehydrogenase kinase [Microthyrium microscopicum]|uniref:Protein-serine/threonine kinase n=1 Tax=Microthyrium microscopicum TaxID=703497 RepID=A0A6A6TT61_9PEZI|nr:alpha-ketoacid dehydrogenase kinase [Microthyrium microscopicum]
MLHLGRTAQKRLSNIGCSHVHSCVTTRRYSTRKTPPWRPSFALDEWVQRDARPISLRQLTFFGRTLTEDRLLNSANYVRTELPTRIAHRLRDMQTLPYIVLTNDNLSHVYELYYKAFERFRKIPEVKTIEQNDKFCAVVKETLKEHLTVIPRLVRGVIEVQDYMKPDSVDKFVTTLLRSRISRRVIAEQHIALSDTFHELWQYPGAEIHDDPNNADHVGEIFLRCNAREVIEGCAKVTRDLMQKMYGLDCQIPEIHIQGHLDATFPYILSHLEYIIGELLRNSIQATIEQLASCNQTTPPSPIDVLICETPQHVIMRISDRGGGIPRDVLPHLWSFSKGPHRAVRLKNLNQVPRLAATMQELKGPPQKGRTNTQGAVTNLRRDSSLSSLASRSPDMKLGIGLPMSKIYAEYWAGSLEIHSLEGYGVDAFLQISKLGNKNEHITTRATMDAV